MKRILSLLLAGVMMASFVACSNTTNSAPRAVSGTFEGEAQGFHAPVKVSVTLENGAITSVEVLEHAETEGVSDYAIATMPQRIVDAQSYNVDTCSGATFSSMAIKNAVKAAVAESGAEGLDAKVSQTAEDTTLDADVVIVGAGLAGMSAAVEAAEAGANVVILEKLDRVGGSSVTAGGIVVGLHTSLNAGLNDEDTEEEMLNYYLERSNHNVDEELVKFWVSKSSESCEWLIDNGVQFVTIGTSGTSPRNRAHTTANGGAGVTKPIEALMNSYENVTLIRHAEVTDVLTDENGVCGVVADNYGATLIVNAKTVILTAGGYDADDEMRATYSPESADSYCMSSCGNTGDWIAWAEKLGAATRFEGGVMGMHTSNPYYTLTGGINLYSFLGTLGVNAEGVRFQNENSDYPIYDANMKADGSDHFWHIFSSTSLDVFDSLGYYSTVTLESYLGTEYVVKADTLDELAEATGMDAETLKATVARYNELAVAGVDDDFGAVGMMPIAEEGPYYAVKVVKATVASFGGICINENAQVIGTDGNAIAGLYAAGECANGQLLEMVYPASGTMLNIATTFGRIAGQNAAAEALA